MVKMCNTRSDLRDLVARGDPAAAVQPARHRCGAPPQPHRSAAQLQSSLPSRGPGEAGAPRRHLARQPGHTRYQFPTRRTMFD